MTDEPIRVLLVDDEVGFLEVLTKRMGRRGFDMTAAPSGTDGIQVLRKADFDVAVLDLKLEDMDGIEVLTIFKKMVPEMPVIMLTGHGSEQAASEGLAQGAFDYLLKPCDLDELIAKIQEAVDQNRE
ncbi:response regulator [Pseudodesulfovibrio sp. zrk46]|uniref:response regulator n=1 Tax=Pseudodesulfovibrio sp. zrk46 TaxID=2725288 RepID=UPI001448D7C6|nr:response regulator [Pseudodesulfovibrio sp. zrk46]QJB56717.1 response regulator [Pseudodesulfovibrio sp. zrk46]